MNPNVTSKVYPWQQTTWDTLTTRFPNIGHGLLFYGKQGCGKHAFAKQFLAWVLCLNKQPQGPCGECSSCQWLKSDTHPNYVHITTDEENKKQNAKIKIEKIRDLLPFVQQTGEGWRVIVIEPAEALNLASSNALLKTLEEPGERVVLILLADHYLKLPATIRSRLQHFALDRISYEQATSYLNEHLSELAEVQPDLLLGLSNDMPLIFSGKWQKELNFNDFIMLFEYLLGDLICVKLTQPQKNTDLDFDQLSPYYDLESLFNIYSELQQAKKLVEQNVQSQLIIDQLFITLMNI